MIAITKEILKSVDDFKENLLLYDLTSDFSSIFNIDNSVVCTGPRICNFGINNSQELLKKIIETFQDKSFEIKNALPQLLISGCPNSCAQPCRFKYNLYEERESGDYHKVNEGDTGMYFMNSKDLCMIEHIPELIEAGINSFKIEGRMKSSYYVASVVKAYRQAIDKYIEDPKNYKYDPKWMEELEKPSHRPYTTGFYLDEEIKFIMEI